MPLSLRPRFMLSTAIACMAVYGIIFLVLNHIVHSETFWHELIETPRARTDITVTSIAYALMSAILAILSGWKPEGAPRKWLRTSFVFLTLVAALGSALLLVVVVVNMDWKMSL